MIISCLNCNKKFNIDEKLIPENGRLLQCSNCNNKWYYRIPNKENEIVENVKLGQHLQKVTNNNDKKISINPSSTKKNNNQKINKKNNKNKSLNIKNINKNITLANILNNLIIIFITFVALILILDTFKSNISNFLPILIPLLDNLYLSIFDLISFIKDLFN